MPKQINLKVMQDDVIKATVRELKRVRQNLTEEQAMSIVNKELDRRINLLRGDKVDPSDLGLTMVW